MRLALHHYISLHYQPGDVLSSNPQRYLQVACACRRKQMDCFCCCLEKTGQWEAAATGYATAHERWNQSFIAWMGLGNSKYNLKEFDSSADAFSRASQLQPENGLAYNNLANILAEQGKREEALTAAQRAVDLGGPFQDTFRQTLAEIKRMEKNKVE